jgi:FlaA1/EpsC-like NDP-sugar epimerase
MDDAAFRRAYWHPLLLAVADLAAVGAAWVVAMYFRDAALPAAFCRSHAAVLPVLAAAYLLLFYVFGLYRTRWEFASLEMLWPILTANTLATLLSMLLCEHDPLPIAVSALVGLLATGFVGGLRLLLRVAATRRQRTRHPDPPKRTVILGEAASVVDVLDIVEKDAGRYEILGILDDDPRFHGNRMRGHNILGPLDTLHDLLHQHAVDEVILALPHAGDAQLRRYVLACCRHKVAVRVLPVLAELLEHPTEAPRRLRLHTFRVDDLLHRAPVHLTPDAGGYAGRRVLVTGAGGSIGSELCRQIVRMGPASLTLLGHGENSIVAIERELARTAPGVPVEPVICDVRDAARLHAILARARPEVLLHAAAHKHVPLMEGNVAEAVHNNVAGTRNVVRAATGAGVARLVLISTDKAVNPSSVMGATKFLCEELVNAAVARAHTCGITVRFGNVLGSRGSVLPLFQEQILHGGPLTVTHPEMDRYFMTIPEAVSLVLQAGARGTSGSLFVLDMGKPVRILDLAEDVIRLSGLEPYRDIDIAFCGLRAGEKLSEELFTYTEAAHAETQERLLVVRRPAYLDHATIDDTIDALLAVAATHDDDAVLAALRAIIPTFRGHAAPIQPAG